MLMITKLKRRDLCYAKTEALGRISSSSQHLKLAFSTGPHFFPLCRPLECSSRSFTTSTVLSPYIGCHRDGTPVSRR